MERIRQGLDTIRSENEAAQAGIPSSLAPEPEASPAAPRPAGPFRTIWMHPRATIRSIVTADPRHRVVAIVAGAGLARALLRAAARDLGDRMPLAGVLATCLALGPALTLLALYLGAAILRVVGGWLGGRASTAEVRAALAWGAVPYLAVLALWAPALLIGGEALFTSAGPGLAPPGTRLALVVIYLADMVLLGWSLVLMLACLAEVFRMSVWRVVVANLLMAPALFAILLVPIALLAVFDAARKARFETPPVIDGRPPIPPPTRVPPPRSTTRPDPKFGPALAEIWDEGCRVWYGFDHKRPGRPVVSLEIDRDDPNEDEAVDRGLRHLRDLPDLERLHVHIFSGATAAGLAHLAGRTKLRSLDLGDGVTDDSLAPLEDLSGLRELTLYSDALTDAGLTHLRGLTQLRKLNVWANKVTDAGLANLAGMTELEEVVLKSVGIGGPGLHHLRGAKSLRSLYLSDCTIGGDNLAYVRRLESVRILDIGGMERGVLDDASLVHLEGWAGLETLFLGFTNPIRGPGLVHLRGLTGLRRLDLTNSPVTDAGVEHLKALRGLRKLNLGGTRITPAGLKALLDALPETKIDPPGLAR